MVRRLFAELLIGIPKYEAGYHMASEKSEQLNAQSGMGADNPRGPRRNFLLTLWIIAQGILAAFLVVPGLRYFIQPIYEKVQTSRVQLGDFRALPEGEPTRVDYNILQRAGYQVEELQEFVYVLRNGEQVTVYSPTCTHMGCNVAWDAEADEFQCPCHGGRYNIRGEVIGGPPPRPLTELASSLQDGTIWITLGEES